MKPFNFSEVNVSSNCTRRVTTRKTKFGHIVFRFMYLFDIIKHSFVISYIFY